MDDLIAFIKARLDEDEANGRHALALWPSTHFTIDPGSLVIVEFHRRHDPDRDLREIAAKRAILAMDDDSEGYAYSVAVSRAIVHLAAAWSDHPDYRAEWAPDASALPDHG
jgi:hypothetical protein